MSVQKQTLRANNRALAQNLAKTRQELRQLTQNLQEVQSQNQELKLELNRLHRIAGIKDGEIEEEVQKRMRVGFRPQTLVSLSWNNSKFDIKAQCSKEIDKQDVTGVRMPFYTCDTCNRSVLWGFELWLPNLGHAIIFVLWPWFGWGRACTWMRCRIFACFSILVRS